MFLMFVAMPSLLTVMISVIMIWIHMRFLMMRLLIMMLFVSMDTLFMVFWLVSVMVLVMAFVFWLMVWHNEGEGDVSLVMLLRMVGQVVLMVMLWCL